MYKESLQAKWGKFQNKYSVTHLNGKILTLIKIWDVLPSYTPCIAQAVGSHSSGQQAARNANRSVFSVWMDHPVLTT